MEPRPPRPAVRRLCRLGLGAWLLLCGTAPAQIAIPQVPLPPLPAVTPPDLGATVQAASDVTGNVLRTRLDARTTLTRALIRDNRAAIEADPSGAPLRRAELLATAPSAAALIAAQAAGFSIARQESHAELGLELVVLRAPAGLATRRALARLRALDPQGSYDYNHIYVASGDATAGAATDRIAPAAGERGEPAASLRIGMIDGGINTGHPALVSSALHTSGCDGGTRPTGHGTAVASLIVAAASLSVTQARIELHAADVYCGQPVGGAVDALAVALATLVRNQVAIINISLVGPRNQAMERLIHAVRQRGILIVAAVGNDGPAAKPLYPAAFPDVIAVTAVDAKQRVLAEACRGAHVQFAAPGAELLAADAQHGYVAIRGTSFAAPIVTGLLGALIVAHAGDAEAARAVLAAQAIDVGRRGRDPVYGHGVVGMPVMTAAPQH